MRTYLLILAIFIDFVLFGQDDCLKQFNGLLLDSTTSEPIEFVNVGILHSSIGTISNSQGRFALKIDVSKYQDSVFIISAIGYLPVILSVKALYSDFNYVFKLKPKIYETPEILIKSYSLKEKRYGITSDGGGIIHGVVHGYEKALLIPVKSSRLLLKSVNFNLTGILDTVLFRINFYSASMTGPNIRIIDKNMVFRYLKASDGWIECDLQSEHLVFDSDFYIGVELLPQFINDQSIRPQYTAKFTNKGKLFSRDFFDKWFEIKGIGVPIYVSYYEL